MNSPILLQVERIQSVIEEILGNPYILEKFNVCGYDPKKLMEGSMLCERLLLLQQAKAAQQHPCKLKTKEQLQIALHEAYQLYNQHIRLAQRTVPHKQKLWDLLQLRGNRKRDISGWLQQATAFYEHISIITPHLTLSGVTVDELEQNYAMIKAIIQARQGQCTKQDTIEIAEHAQKLHAWYTTFSTVAKTALNHDAEILAAFNV